MSDKMEGHATRLREPGENERLIDHLRPYQLAKLTENAHKGHWGNEDPLWLLERARQELDELEKAIRLHRHWACSEDQPSLRFPASIADTAENVARECADVANFVAMVAQVVAANVALWERSGG